MCVSVCCFQAWRHTEMSPPQTAPSWVTSFPAMSPQRESFSFLQESILILLFFCRTHTHTHKHAVPPCTSCPDLIVALQVIALHKQQRTKGGERARAHTHAHTFLHYVLSSQARACTHSRAAGLLSPQHHEMAELPAVAGYRGFYSLCACVRVSSCVCVSERPFMCLCALSICQLNICPTSCSAHRCRPLISDARA